MRCITEGYDMNQKYVKIMGLIGSIILGTATMLSGDIVTGAGIITAALSSSSILGG